MKDTNMSWIKVSGSAQRYQNTETGETLSRRQFDKRYGSLSQDGFTSYEARQKAADVLREKGGAAKAVANERGLSREARNIRESWKRNAEKSGLDTRIRKNGNFQAFKSEIKSIEQSQADLLKRFGGDKRAANTEYKKQKLDTYLKFGLISRNDYDHYMGV
jgi:hypothetical protein